MIAWLVLACTGPPAPDRDRSPVDTIDSAAPLQRPIERRGTGWHAHHGTSLAWAPPHLVVSHPGNGGYEDQIPAGVALLDPLVQPDRAGMAPVASLIGEAPGGLMFAPSQFGTEVMAPGDLTGDGEPELVVFDVTDVTDAGAWIFTSPLDAVRSANIYDHAVPIRGEVPWRGTPCGDLDQDGLTDLCTAVGVDLSPVHFPVDGWDLTWSGIEDRSDIRVVSGDLDRDGVPELIVTDPSRGFVHRLTTFPQGDHDLISIDASTWVTPSAPTALHAGADLDGDGRGDLVVAWPGQMVIATELFGDLPDDAHATLDAKVLAIDVADLDGDGQDDLVVGETGRVLVFLGPIPAGPLHGEDADNVLVGHEGGGQSFGASVLARDMDGDGDAELAVGVPGEPYADGNGTPGMVYVFHDPHTFSWADFDPPLEPLPEPKEERPPGGKPTSP